MNGTISESFQILQGVRQGENLSPFLFAWYVNDLEEYMINEGCKSVDMGLDFDDRVMYYLKILITLYADDTVIFAEIKINFKKH